jgi:hypothetical protein
MRGLCQFQYNERTENNSLVLSLSLYIYSLGHYATNREVAGSSPDEVDFFFN